MTDPCKNSARRLVERDWGDWTCPTHPLYQDWLYHRQKYRAIVQTDRAAFRARADAYARPQGAVHRLARMACASLLSWLRWAFGLDDPTRRK